MMIMDIDLAKQRAKEEITRLVERFEANNKGADMNEQTTRLSFILPMFRALGWDVEDPTEMSSEEQISRGFVDFGFYLNAVPVFYLETKRASEKLNNPKFMRQAINYSYLKGVTWAVLTDFEQLMVFNANIEVKNPKDARFLDLTYTDYAEARFDDLWLLSKYAMHTREIDGIAQRYGRMNVKEDVTRQLFADLTKWRRRLFNEMFQQSDKLWAQNPREVDNAVQRFFDRLIFIRSVEDRDIEQPRLKSVVRQSKGKDLFPNILKMFRELDEIYNSNLFATHRLDDLEVHDPDLLIDIINGLYTAPGGYVDYDFNAIKADVLGAVYEQYLGFRAVDPEGKDEVDAKRKKRKEQGIYYTPQYVVSYIIKQTLGKLLEDGADVRELRILDPACGSGAFLIEAFDVLNAHYASLYPKATPEEQQAWRFRILTENLYGVDLDDQAVEVTRLNLMMRAAQGRKKLPLLTHIKCGNSLIDDPAIAGDAAFDWEERFPDVMGRGGFDVVVGNPPYVRQETLGTAFKAHVRTKFDTYAGSADLYVYFIEQGMNLLRDGGHYGVIVANKWLRANYGSKLRTWLKQWHIHEIVDFGDLPVFQEATTYPCVITVGKAAPPESITAVQVETLDFESFAAYAAPRRYTVSMKSLDESGWSLVSADAQAVLDKLKAVGVPLSVYVEDKIYYGIKTGLNKAFVIDETTRNRLIDKDPKSAEIIKPFLAGRDIKRYMPLHTDNYLIFTRRGIEIEKYPAILEYLEQFKTQLTPKPADWNGGTWPGRKAGNYEWYEIQDAVDYFKEFEKPKIIIPAICQNAQNTLDEDGTYSNDKTTIVSSNDLYLLGMMNSQVADFVIHSIAATKSGGYFEYKPMYISQIPIRTINFDDPADKANHDRMVTLVETMLRLKREHAEAEASFDDRRHELAAQIENTDKAIDALVYALYGLTEDEIAVVAGDSPSS